MSGVFQDLRHGLRALVGHSGLTVATAVSLGLAIGAQTSVYCLIDALFLRAPVGVTDAQRLWSSPRGRRLRECRYRRRRNRLSRTRPSG